MNENNTAWITSCKLQTSGWLVNGSMGVPNDPANRHCADVLAWIAEGNTPDAQFTDAEIAANAQAELNETSQAYLASTDWYITEFPTHVGMNRLSLWVRAVSI